MVTAQEVDQEWTQTFIRWYLRSATRVKFVYATVAAVNVSAKQVQATAPGGVAFWADYGLGVPNAGEVWRFRRRFGAWSADDWVPA